MKNTKIILICFALSITTSSCCSYKKLANSNPTSYVFEANIEQVKSAIKKINILDLSDFRDYSYYKENYYYAYIFKDSVNINDAVAYCIDCESKMYFRFGFPYPYDASFHIHLDSNFENKTEVEVFTLNPKIIIFGMGIGHVGFTWTKKVCPSTMEEYEILLAIGKQLGEKGMPPCNYPKKWLKYQAKQQK